MNVKNKNKNTYSPALRSNKDMKTGGEYKKQSSTDAISSYQPGLLGKLFGQGINAKNNIVGISTTILVLTVAAGWAIGGYEPPNSITAVLSTLVGYFIANKRTDD